MHADIGPLDFTSQQLQVLPKADKDQHINSYLQAQRLHAKSYAEEGRAFMVSWNPHSSCPGEDPPSAEMLPIGFGTPILKHRVRRAVQDRDVDSSSRDDEVRPDHNENLKPIAHVEEKTAHKVLQEQSLNKKVQAQSKPRCRKRNIKLSDGEQEARKLQCRQAFDIITLS